MKKLTFRGLNKKESTVFKEIQKKMIKAGLKTNLPTSIKEYTKQYTGSKIYAKDDYYFEWSQVMGKFFNKLGKKAKKVNDVNKLGYNLNRTEFTEIKNTSLLKTLQIYNMHLNTLINVTNKNFLNTKLTDEEKKKLVKKKSRKKIDIDGVKYNEVLEGGIKSTKTKQVTLKDFGGSTLKLAYNNFLLSLTYLGYTKSLTYAVNMSVSDWYEVFKQHDDIMQFVYVYDTTADYTKSDEFILWLLQGKDEKDFQGNTVDILNEYLRNI